PSLSKPTKTGTLRQRRKPYSICSPTRARFTKTWQEPGRTRPRPAVPAQVVTAFSYVRFPSGTRQGRHFREPRDDTVSRLPRGWSRKLVLQPGLQRAGKCLWPPPRRSACCQTEFFADTPTPCVEMQLPGCQAAGICSTSLLACGSTGASSTSPSSRLRDAVWQKEIRAATHV